MAYSPKPVEKRCDWCKSYVDTQFPMHAWLLCTRCWALHVTFHNECDWRKS